MEMPMFFRMFLLDRRRFFLVGTIAMSALISSFMCSPAQSVTIQDPNFASLTYTPPSADVIEGNGFDFTVQITNRSQISITFQSITPQPLVFLGGDMDDAVRDMGSFQNLPNATPIPLPIPPGRLTLPAGESRMFTHHIETTDQSGVNDHDAGLWRIGAFAAFEVNLGAGVEVHAVATDAFVTVIDPPIGAIPEPSTMSLLGLGLLALGIGATSKNLKARRHGTPFQI